MLRALIFDFDGLILDTETPEVEAWRVVFRRYGQEFPDSYWINAIGRGADQILETPMQLLVRMCGQNLDISALRAEQHALYFSAIEEMPPRAGIPELIAEARSEGLRLGVASSSKHDWVDGHLTRLGLFSEFDAITCADDVPRAKPFPDLYLAACARLGVETSEAIAIEDSPNGIAAARAADLTVVAYPNPLTVQLDISAASAIVVKSDGLNLHNFRDLLASR